MFSSSAPGASRAYFGVEIGECRNRVTWLSIQWKIIAEIWSIADVY